MHSLSKFLLSALFCGLLHAQITLTPKLKQGAELLYNFDLSNASRIFEQAIREKPEDPLGYYFKAQVSLWRYLGNGEKRDLENFSLGSDQAIEKAQAQLADKSKAEDASLLLGNVYTQRVIAYGKAEKFLDMIWAAQKAQSYLNDVLEMNRSNYDAYLGLGLFKFFLSQTPAAFRWALNLIGFEADLKAGIELLRVAAQKSGFTQVESRYYYSQIVMDYLMDYSAAAKSLTELQNKYPDNLMIAYSLGILHIKSRNLKAALPLISNIASIRNTQFTQLRAYAHFLLGEIHYKQNKFERALPAFQTFLDASPDKNYTGLANLRVALCLMQLGRTQESKPYLNKAKSGNDALDDDHYARRAALLFEKDAPGEERLSLMRFENFIEDGQYRQAVDSLTALLKNLRDETIDGETRYQLGMGFLLQKQYTPAAECAKAAIAARSKQTWVTPFSHLLLAEAQFGMNNVGAAIKNLAAAEAFSDFEYMTKFKMRLTAIKYRNNCL